MKRSIIATTLALCVGCATGVAVRDLVVVPARAQGQVGPSYEYRVVRINSYDETAHQSVVTKFGSEGWRLSGVTGSERVYFFYFERQLPR